jgi:hypothetical protein
MISYIPRSHCSTLTNLMIVYDSRSHCSTVTNLMIVYNSRSHCSTVTQLMIVYDSRSHCSTVTHLMIVYDSRSHCSTVTQLMIVYDSRSHCSTVTLVMPWCTVSNMSPPLHSSAFTEKGGNAVGWIGTWRRLGYSVPELPPNYTSIHSCFLCTPLVGWPIKRVNTGWVTF